MTFSSLDISLMQRAIGLAEKGLYSTTPNPRVGCVIATEDGRILGEGYHRKAGENHAEINALESISPEVDSLKNAAAYVTLEPCSHQGRTGPCSEALVKAGIGRVVYGMEDPNPQVSGRGLLRMREGGIQVEGPLLEQQALALNPGFIKRMSKGLPWVRCKMAMSLDGRTAMASGESKWVTGPAARADVQKLRARSCAIVTGVDSVLHDDPQLTVRLTASDRQPLRVVVDSKLRSPSSALIFQQPGTTCLASCASSLPEGLRSAKLWTLPEYQGRVDLRALIKKLAEEDCNEVLVETGATLAGAFISAGLVDELVIYMAAKLLGSSARPLFDLSINTMNAQLSLSIKDIRAVGADWRITAVPDPEA